MTRITPPPFAHSSGPRDAKIAIVGEAFGASEDLVGRPFQGSSGQELTRMLDEAGIRRNECFLTNTLAFRPPNNDLEALTATKKELPAEYPLPAIMQGKYLRPEFLPEVLRLKEELSLVRPNLCIALGNVACWALLGTRGITTIRGVATMSTLVPGLKVLPTYHPSFILRQWQHRVIAIADLIKAKGEAKSPELTRPARRVLERPTFVDMQNWVRHHIPTAKYLTIDIETHKRQIEMIGFATDPINALVVPFMNRTQSGRFIGNFWENEQDEIAARKFCQELLISDLPKVFQNGLYDMQYLLREGFRLKNVAEDTMLLHHSLYPELQKGLGFLGSIYTNEASWKLLGRTRADEPVKKDD